MPSTGTPRSNTTCGARGEFASVTDSGPPDRITARGANAGMLVMGAGNREWGIGNRKSGPRLSGCIVAGESTTSNAPSGAFDDSRFPIPDSRYRLDSVETIVRRFLGDRDVVHVRLAYAGARDAHELRLDAQFVDGRAADVTHRRAQAADELVHDVAQRPAVRHAAFDAFGHELVGVGLVLEIAVLGAFLHGAERPH